MSALWLLAVTAHAQVTCGSVITQNTTLTADLDCSGITTTVIRIDAAGVTFDGGGHKIIAPNAAVRIEVLRDDVTVKNVDVSGEGGGVGVRVERRLSRCRVQNVTANRCSLGVHLRSGDGSVPSRDMRVERCRVTNCASGLYVEAGVSLDYVLSGNDCSTAIEFGIRVDSGNRRTVITTDNVLNGCTNGIQISRDTTIENWDMSRFGIRGAVITIFDGFGNVIRNVDASDPLNQRFGVGIRLRRSSFNRIERCKVTGRSAGIVSGERTGNDVIAGTVLSDNELVGNDLSSNGYGVLLPFNNATGGFDGDFSIDRHERYLIAGNNFANCGVTGIFLGRSASCTVTTSNVLTGCFRGVTIGSRTELRNWDLSSANINDRAIEAWDFFREGGIVLENIDVSRPTRDGAGTGVRLINAIAPVLRNIKASGRNIGIEHDLLNDGTSVPLGTGAVYSGNDVSFCRSFGIRFNNDPIFIDDSGTPISGPFGTHTLYSLSGNRANDCGVVSASTGWGMFLRDSNSLTVTSTNTVAGSANGIRIHQRTALDAWGANLGRVRGTAVEISAGDCRVTSADLSSDLAPADIRVGTGVRLDNAPRTELRDLRITGRSVAVDVGGNSGSPNLKISRSTLANSGRGLIITNSPSARIFHNNITGNNVYGIEGSSALRVSTAPTEGASEAGNYWGRSCPATLFVSGTDTSRADIVDPLPFGRANGWDLGDRPGCAGLVNNAPRVSTSLITPFAPVFSEVRFEASASDLDGDRISYSWSQATGPVAVTLFSGTAASTGFAANVTGAYDFAVTVSDGRGGIATGTISATVIPDVVGPTASVAFLPANAISSSGLVIVVVTFSERLQADPTLTLVRESGDVNLPGGTMTPTAVPNQYSLGFNAFAGLTGTYRAQVAARDLSNNPVSQQPANSRIAINVPLENQSPVADAGKNRDSSAGVEVSLSGAAADPDNDPLQYSWAQVSGPAALVLIDSNTPRVRFTPQQTGAYVLRLTVTDGRGGVAQASTAVTVVEPRPDLEVSSLDAVPASVAVGGSVPVRALVVNRSPVAVAPATTLRFVLSTDRIVTTTDASLGTINLPSLAPLAAFLTPASGSVAVPQGQATGDYFTGAIVDPSGIVPESDESNNSLAASTRTAVVVLTDDNPANDINDLSSLASAPQIRTTGSLEVVGDADVFRVPLTAGIEYLFDTATGETVFDSELTLYNPRREVLIKEDDSCGQFQARLRWRALETGEHFLEIRAHNDVTSGRYGLRFGPLATLAIFPPVFPVARQGEAFSFRFTATGGVPPPVWDIVAGSPPPGVNLDPASGTFSGMPAARGTFTFTVRARDADCRSPSTTASVVSLAVSTPSVIAPLAITRPPRGALLSGSLGRRLGLRLEASGGLPPYTFSLATGSLPSGLAVQDGFLFGAPEQAGRFPVSLAVTDSRPISVTSTAVLDIARPPTPRFAVSSAISDRGKTRYNVSISGVQEDLTLIQLSIDFDSTKLSFDETLGENFPPGELLGGPGATLRVLQPAPGRLVVTVFAPSTSPIHEDGILLGLRFTPVESPAPSSLLIADVALTTPQGRVILQPPVASAGFSSVSRFPVFFDPLDGLSRPFVRLDGRFSRDSNLPRQRLTYAWTAPAGTQLSDPASATPTFVPTGPGSFDFSLTVANEQFSSEPKTVTVVVRTSLSPPTAIPRLRLQTGSFRSAIDPALVVRAGQFVELSGDGSVDPDGGPLSYAWKQVAGPPVLPPGTRSARPVVPAPDAGLYVFELVVGDSTGLFSPARTIQFQCVPQGLLTLSLDLTATSPQVALPGDSARSLRVTVPTTVTLSGEVAGSGPLAYTWRQLGGPIVRIQEASGLAVAAGHTRGALGSRFEPAIAGVYEFELDLSSAGRSVGRGRIRVLVDAAEESVPAAVATATSNLSETKRAGTPRRDSSPARARQARELAVPPGTTITLNATGSSPLPGRALTYRWTQVHGPAVVLSNPFSPVTTFVTPSLQGGEPAQILFLLFATDGALLSEPAASQILITDSRMPGTFTFTLTTGVNLLSFPLEPELSGRSVLDFFGGSFLSRPVDGGRFSPAVRGAPALAIGAGDGFVLHVPAASTTEVSGLLWPDSSRTVRLRRGLNLLGAPTTSTTMTALSLSEATGAGFVCRAAAGRKLAFEAYLPEADGADYPIEPGKAYLLSLPQDITFTWP